MKPLFFLSLLLLSSCTISTLDEKEKRLVGNWLKPINDEQLQGAYMELHDDHTGVWGLAIKENGEVGLLTYMSMLIKDWRIKNDTLSIQVKLRPGLVFRGPNGKEYETGSVSSALFSINSYLLIRPCATAILSIANQFFSKNSFTLAFCKGLDFI